MTQVVTASRVVPLEWDSRHFGFAIGRLEGGIEGVEAALAEAQRARIRLLLARREVSEIDEVQCLEQHGFRLADTLVRYAQVVPGISAEGAGGVRIRPAAPGDAAAVEALAAEAFEGYPGHFRNDQRLDPRRADLVYVLWAKNGCLSSGPSQMFLAELDGRLVGLGLVTRAGAGVAEGELYAVTREARGRGIAGRLVHATLQWAQAQGFGQMVVYSSVANPSAHRVWLRAGFVPAGGLYTFHRWLDGASG